MNAYPATVTRGVKHTKAQIDGVSAGQVNRGAADYIRKAYGLTDADTVDKVSFNRSTRIVTVTFTIGGPRRGTKWRIG